MAAGRGEINVWRKRLAMGRGGSSYARWVEAGLARLANVVAG